LDQFTYFTEHRSTFPVIEAFAISSDDIELYRNFGRCVAAPAGGVAAGRRSGLGEAELLVVDADRTGSFGGAGPPRSPSIRRASASVALLASPYPESPTLQGRHVGGP
jgi:hypothetical protein